MKANTAGFTLIELMFTIAVAAVLLAVGVPNFRDFVRNSRMAGAANDIITDFNLARSEAIKRGVPVTLCKSQDGATCDADAVDPFNRWIVFVDDADPAVVDGANARRTTFRPTGFPVPNAAGMGIVTAMRLCDVRGNVVAIGGESAARAVLITATGRPVVTRSVATITARGDCP
jgi:type IV fimbrial biogenesis protein FimT